MILSFRNEGTEDIFNGDNTQAARKTCPQSLWQVAARKLDQLDSVTILNELRVPRVINWKHLPRIGEANTVFVSTGNIGFVLFGLKPVLNKSR